MNSSETGNHVRQRISSSLLLPIRTPVFSVKLWQDYPDYALQLKLALEKCNLDKLLFQKIMAGEYEKQ